MCSHGDAPLLDPRTSRITLPGYPKPRCSSEQQVVPYLELLPLDDADTKQYCNDCNLCIGIEYSERKEWHD